MEFNRKAHPDCVYADNPFHECASACLERIAQGNVKKNPKKQTSRILSFSGSFGRKKKESYSQPPSPLSAKPYQNGGGVFANANSPKVHHAIASPVTVKTKTVTESKKSFSSSSGDPDDFFNHKPEKKPSQFTPLSPNNLVDRNKVVSPKPGKQEQNGEIRVFSFLSPPRSNEKESNSDYTDDDEDDDDEREKHNEIGVELDLESVMSDTVVSVGKYRVRSGSSTILTAIIEKHGDIAENCKLESDSMRSRYLECLCSLMQELRSTPVGQITKAKVKEMLAVLRDLESVNIEVAWLRSIIEEFGRFQEEAEHEKEKRDGLIKAKREELEAQEADLVKIEKEVAEARLRIEETRGLMIEMEMEQSRIEKMGFKMEKFKGKSFIDELI